MKRATWMPAALAVAVVLTGAALFLTGCENEIAAEVLGGSQTAQAEEPVTETAIVEMPAEIAGVATGMAETDAGGKGGPPEEESIVPGVIEISNLGDNASAYVGMTVTVQGTILAQCIRGCRFSLHDGTGVVNIELVDEALENVLMKGSVGRIVEVRGIVDSTSPTRILVEDRTGWSYVD